MPLARTLHGFLVKGNRRFSVGEDPWPAPDSRRSRQCSVGASVLISPSREPRQGRSPSADDRSCALGPPRGAGRRVPTPQRRPPRGSTTPTRHAGVRRDPAPASIDDVGSTAGAAAREVPGTRRPADSGGLPYSASTGSRAGTPRGCPARAGRRWRGAARRAGGPGGPRTAGWDRPTCQPCPVTPPPGLASTRLDRRAGTGPPRAAPLPERVDLAAAASRRAHRPPPRSSAALPRADP